MMTIVMICCNLYVRVREGARALASNYYNDEQKKQQREEIVSECTKEWKESQQRQRQQTQQQNNNHNNKNQLCTIKAMDYVNNSVPVKPNT